MTKPKRIQRKHTKGWRMPEGAVYVGRPSKWGNPYKIGTRYRLVTRRGRETMVSIDAHEQAVEAFQEVATSKWPATVFRASVRRELAGKDLACWCPLDRPCHADVLLEIANG